MNFAEGKGVNSACLLNLPNLVIPKLLNFLDFNSLKNLRLVNHSVKSWIDNEPDILKRFYCQISSKSRLNEILTSTTVPWNNFKFYETYDGLEKSPEFFSFLNTFGKSTRNFFFACDKLNATIITQILRNFGPQLESLWIKSTICSPGTTLDSDDHIKICFPKLKEFSYLDNGCDDDFKAKIFSTVLPMCPNLKKINLSRVFDFMTPSDFSNTERTMNVSSQALKIIYNPVIEYLKKLIEFKRKCKLMIDLNGCRNILVPLIQGHSYPLTPTTLIELVKYCGLLGAKLLNVPYIALPNLTRARNLSKSQIESMESVISSIQLVYGSEGSKNIYFPASSKIIVDIHTECSNNYSEFEISGEVETFRLQFFHYEEPIVGLEILYRSIFQRVFPSVRKLKVQRNNSDYLASGREIASNFPNVQKLELTLWGESEIDFQDLLRGLPNLVSLSFPICENCTDGGLLGPDLQNPLILQMKRLSVLRLSGTKVSDLTFQFAFKYMRLKKFVWHKLVGAPELVTFKNGISTLQTVENGFRDSVEILDYDIPEDCTPKEINKFNKAFRNLKSKY